MNAGFAKNDTVSLLRVDLSDEARVIFRGTRRHDVALVASLHNSEPAVARSLVRKNELAHNHSSVHVSIYVLVYTSRRQ